MDSPHNDFKLVNHFSTLIYPFLHDVDSRNRGARLDLLGSDWLPWWGRLTDAELSEAVEDTYFFLPYVRETLFPELISIQRAHPAGSFQSWGEAVRTLSGCGPLALDKTLGSDSVIRLTRRRDTCPLLNPEGTTLQRAVRKPNARRTTAIIFDWCDVVLFPSGIGLLVLRVRLHQHPALLSQLIDINHNLRMVHAPSLNWNLPTFEGQGTSELKLRDLLDFLIQGMNSQKKTISDFRTFVSGLDNLDQARYTESEAGQVLGERCQLLSYACVDVDVPAPERPLMGEFDSIEDRLLFEFASCIPLGESLNNPVWVPSPEQIRELNLNRFRAWRCWRGMALKESVVFLATEDLEFNRSVLPHNIENDYTPLYIYALHQRLRLLNFSIGLMGAGVNASRKLKGSQRLMDDFIDFRNRYWFNEITRKPLGGVLYRKFQFGLEVGALYKLLSRQVREIQEYHERQYGKRVSLFLGMFTFVFLPLGAVIGIFGMTFFFGSWKSFAATCLAVSLASSLAWKLVTRK